MLGQLADAVIGLLRQYHARLRTLERGLARGNDLSAGADIDVGELRLGHDFGGQRLLVLGDCLGVVDLDQHRACRDVLAALNGNLPHAPVDPRRDVEPRRIDFALHQQRLRPHQVPDRKAGDGGDNHADDDRRNTGRRRQPMLPCLPRRFRRRLRRRLRRGFHRPRWGYLHSSVRRHFHPALPLRRLRLGSASPLIKVTHYI
jgi:hypothetical protein